MASPRDLFRLAALDMNGTTVEDSGIFESSLRHGLAEVSLPYPEPDVLAPLRGMAKAEMFRRLIPDPALSDLAYHAFTAAFHTSIRDGAVKPVDGASEVFSELRELGLRVCLITGFPPDLQNAIIRALDWDELIDLSVSSDEVPQGRPHPDVILHAAENLGVTDRRRVVVVGDTVNDLLAGERAGAGLLAGVLTGSHDAAKLRTVPGAHVIDSVAQLPALLTTVAEGTATVL
ncbi:phosphonatase-like hydrolase [Acrocarpospora macrocephala]|uniref:Putative haloacid dehalogenase-like hydrolase n=1 Tax=Acrocarpospora macrocephala TaxID=150177 RepID=A0A5M3WDI7_9ACTN|nr:HAD-IA family hydrolase [Acrocarpospora macrocephala]GES07145.1 putative haloacid dehalogenase-like hydrolase [Acrocarpospora macrocephala]